MNFIIGIIVIVIIIIGIIKYTGGWKFTAKVLSVRYLNLLASATDSGYTSEKAIYDILLSRYGYIPESIDLVKELKGTLGLEELILICLIEARTPFLKEIKDCEDTENMIALLIFKSYLITKYLIEIGSIKRQDNLDIRKISANLIAIRTGNDTTAEIILKENTEYSDLLKFATKSIKNNSIHNLGDIPPIFTYEFAATYPDIVLWWETLSDLEIIKILFVEKLNDNLSDDEISYMINDLDFDSIFENDGIMQYRYKKVIDAYKNTGATLECAID